MSVVVPAILAQTQDDFAALTAKIQPFAKRVHLDLMDGQFAPSTSIPLGDIVLPEGWEVDIHAMFAQPDAQLADLIALKPSLIIIHAEAQGDLVKTVEAIQKAGIKAGVALLRSTVPEDISGLLTVADHALIFSGNLGEYGGTANMLQIEKIRLIKAINPVIEIGWDGGANISNAYTLSLGGVDVVNVGGALAGAEDPTETYRQLDFEVHRKDAIKKPEVEEVPEKKETT